MATKRNCFQIRAMFLSISLALLELPLLAQCVYVANPSSSNVSAYKAGADGTLTPIGLPVPAGAFTLSVAAEPTGRFVYAASPMSFEIWEFGIQATGALTFLGTISAPGDVGYLGIHPSGKFLYGTIGGQGTPFRNEIVAFRINANGSLTSIGSPQPTGEGPQVPVIDATGKFLYTPNWQPGNISEFSIAVDGTLTPIGTFGDRTVSYLSLAAHPSGQFLYSSYNHISGTDDTPGELVTYSIDANGFLKSIGVPPGNQFTQVLVEPQGKFFYGLANRGNTVSAYAINPDGSLTPLGAPAIPVSTGVSPRAFATDPTGSFLYVANGDDNSVSSYSIGRNGGLTPIGSPVPAGTQPYSVATSTCTGSAPPPVTNQVSGTGTIEFSGNSYQFNFVVSQIPSNGNATSGFLTYQTVPGSNISYMLNSTSITSLNINGATGSAPTATFSGTCNDGLPCTFTATMSIASPQSFQLSIMRTEGGPTTSGILQIQFGGS